MEDDGELERPGCLCKTPEREVLGGEPGQAEQEDQGNNCLRDGAIETPDAEAILLNHGKAKGKEKSERCRQEGCEAPAGKAEAAEPKVSSDAQDGNGDVGNHRKAAAVHDAAIPVGIDVTGRSRGGVMKGQG